MWRSHYKYNGRQHASADHLSQQRFAFHGERYRRIAACEKLKQNASIRGDDLEEVVGFLRARGIDEKQVRDGSIPASSLECIKRIIHDTFATRGAIAALHIGNFVGVSFAFLATVLSEMDHGSLAVSVDPNVAHRGVLNPQAHVSALLTACGVQRNTMMIAGYSGGKSISNDGLIFEGYDPEAEFINEHACEGVLKHLGRLCGRRFDVVVMDGNHEASYLVRELELIVPLLTSGALVILDDVDTAWSEIRDVFNRIDDSGLKPLSTDGRIGVARFAPVAA